MIKVKFVDKTGKFLDIKSSHALTLNCVLKRSKSLAGLETKINEKELRNLSIFTPFKNCQSSCTLLDNVTNTE